MSTILRSKIVRYGLFNTVNPQSACNKQKRRQIVNIPSHFCKTWYTKHINTSLISELRDGQFVTSLKQHNTRSRHRTHLAAADHIHLAGQQINYFALAFITPLWPQHHSGHVTGCRAICRHGGYCGPVKESLHHHHSWILMTFITNKKQSLIHIIPHWQLTTQVFYKWNPNFQHTLTAYSAHQKDQKKKWKTAMSQPVKDASIQHPKQIFSR